MGDMAETIFHPAVTEKLSSRRSKLLQEVAEIDDLIEVIKNSPELEKTLIASNKLIARILLFL